MALRGWVQGQPKPGTLEGSGMSRSEDSQVLRKGSTHEDVAFSVCRELWTKTRNQKEERKRCINSLLKKHKIWDFEKLQMCLCLFLAVDLATMYQVQCSPCLFDIYYLFPDLEY